MEEEQSSSKNKIHYNKNDIIKKLNQNKKYISGNTTIIRWEDDMNTNTEMYILKNKFNNLPFIGVVNYEFKREGYCINSYLNGDEYFGYYINDLRNKQGLYIYKPKFEIGNKILRQYYFGLWENDYKEGRGIYLWLNEIRDNKNRNIINNKSYNPFNNFEKANFYAYIGLLKKNKFTKGTLLKKENDNYFVFHGSLQNLKKNGKNCFYYSAKLEQILYGAFKDDKFIDGFVGKYDDNGQIKEIIKYKNKTIINKDKFLPNDNIEELSQKLITFRNIIMSKDYFGILYKVFKDAIDFKNKNMNNIDIFNSDLYIDLMDVEASYNQVSIFKDIEKHIKE
jgi:hypothetical protein